MTETTVFSALTDAEMDELVSKLLSGGHRLERHIQYVYDHVLEDYAPTLYTWREINETRRDVIRELMAR